MSFSSWWLLLLQRMGSRHAVFSSCVSRALGHRLGSCGTWTQFHGMWDLPRSGIEPMSPARAGRFFTTEPPGKPLSTAFVKNTSCVTLGNFMCSLRRDVHAYTMGVRSAYFADCAEGNSVTQSTRGGTRREATAVQREKEDCAELWTVCVWMSGLRVPHLHSLFPSSLPIAMEESSLLGGCPKL